MVAGNQEALRGDFFRPRGASGGNSLRLWRGVEATLLLLVIVEILARLGLALRDPRPVLLVAVIYAAAVGGTLPAVISLILTLIYSAYYFRQEGHAAHAHWAPMSQAVVFAISAVGAVLIVLRQRQMAGDTLRRALLAEQDNGDARVAEQDRLNQAVLGALAAHIAVIDEQGVIIATNPAWDAFARENGSGGGSNTGLESNYLEACAESARSHDRPQDLADARAVSRGIEDVIAGRQPQFTHEYPCDSATQQRWFTLTVSPLTGWRRRGAVISHFDITERKLSEVRVRQRAAELAQLTRRLQKTNEELDQFAYITSHDLRAPLRGIANLSAWIEEDMGERFTPEAHQQMNLLRGRVHRMEAMIDGILEYSRIGRVKATPERIDTGRLVAEVVDLLAPPPGFNVTIARQMPSLQCERLRLGQVFQNLIGNAIKHHDKPAGNVRVDCHVSDDFWEFSVSDDGPGIDPRYHDRIFAIFSTLQPRDKVEASGIGLAIVKKIVEGAGGKISVESSPGGGTTFRFTWPASEAAAASPALHEPEAVPAMQ